ncbi:MAG: putative MPP superfamily phosphohydrolase [Verrucomicrobiales bacterium]|jgi:predicted MPP superfamily phosphohydrolase
MKRRQFLQLAGLGSVAAATVGYAFKVEPDWLSVTRQEVVTPRLPGDLDGLRVAMFGDLHYDPELDEALLKKLVAAVNQESPDLVAIVGDYVEHEAKVISPMLEHLGRIKARHGIYAVMGNHDGWTLPGEKVKRQFEASGIDFLINANSQITINQSRLAIAGTDNVWDGNPDLAAAFKGVANDSPVLALIHEPDYFDTVTTVRSGVLQLSGHSHGGQCRVPLVGYAPQTVSWGRKYLHGEFGKSGSRLFVTRGVGTTGIRVRFACRPELVMLTLRSPEVVASQA